MDREDCKDILMMIQVAFPNYKPQDKTVAINLWEKMLKDYNYSIVESALRTYIVTDTSGFAPSIGQLIAIVQKCTAPEQLGELEAWSLVRKAIGNGNYGAEEEFAKLPPVVQRAVGSADMIRRWAMSDSKEVSTVIQSNFLRSYRIEVKREEEYARMPSDVKRLISSIPQLQIEQKEKPVELPAVEEPKRDIQEIETAIDECRKKLRRGK